VRIGVDTGGTFTDCVLIDGARILVAKLPSSPSAPHEAIAAAIQEVLDGSREPVESVTHGTTVATNAIITGDLARVGLITTTGFRDVLEIGTQMRPRLYDLRQTPRPQLVARDLRLEVGGRIAAGGEEIEPLDEPAVERACEQLIAAGVDAIAVATLFSFANPEHEQRIQALVRELAPDVYVGRSSAVSGEPREYQRFATAAVNAALAPVLDPYIRGLEHRLDGTRLFVMQSNGGVSTAQRSVGEHAHRLVLSGPAAGVIGGAREAAAAGHPDCVTFDVGGTSADVAIVPDGRPRSAVDMTLPNGVPCKVPHIEIETIGAGGGSIARIDAGGLLTVGPQSAGADPGPACYRRGGTEPTVTDAQLILGRFAPAGLIGGALALDVDAARAAVTPVAERLGTSVEDAALGILAVIEENMAGAIRRAAAAHGDDLRDYALVAGGGAGPLFAAAIARNLGMPAAIVPEHPGLLSALGLLGAPLRHDLVAPLLAAELELDAARVEAVFAGLEAEGAIALAEDGVAPGDRGTERGLDVRYLGQEYVVPVPLRPGEPLEAVFHRFHGLHEETFGYAAPGTPVEVVAARLVATGRRPAPDLARALPAEAAAPAGTRDVRFEIGQDALPATVFDRSELARGQVVHGPAVIEQLDTTTLLHLGSRATVHEGGALIVEAG